MKRYSQRQGLVTLSEINITPLLDLAFVLLIIFMITASTPEQGLDINLPGAEGPTRELEEETIVTVEINQKGEFYIEGKLTQSAELEADLLRLRSESPQMTVYLRADRQSDWGNGMSVMDICSRYGIPLAPAIQPESAVK